MFDYTHNNQFRFGYDGEWFNLPEDRHQEFQIAYGQSQWRPKSLAQECRVAAKLIANNSLGLLPNIGFSGGVDSEVVVRIFMEEQIPFKITILKFANDLNLHDISFAIAYCERQGLEYELVYLDIEAFLDSNELLAIADRTKCISPQICTLIWLLEYMDELPVFGFGGFGMAKTIPGDYIPGVSEYPSTEWTVIENERQLAPYRHCIQTGKAAIPGFYRYTPALFRATLDNQMIRDLVANKIPGKLCTTTSKCKILQNWFPDIQMRPKFNGFERVSEQEQRVRKGFIDRLPGYNRESQKIEYYKLMNHLYPDGDYATGMLQDV